MILLHLLPLFCLHTCLYAQPSATFKDACAFGKSTGKICLLKNTLGKWGLLIFIFYFLFLYFDFIYRKQILF